MSTVPDALTYPAHVVFASPEGNELGETSTLIAVVAPVAVSVVSVHPTVLPGVIVAVPETTFTGSVPAVLGLVIVTLLAV